MLKYVDTMIGLREIPDQISLCINISGCIFKCPNCHSSYLQEDIGEELYPEVLDSLIRQNEGITCICLMGGSNDLQALNKLMYHCKLVWPELKRAVYLGNDCFPVMLNLKLYDYIKIGHYDEKLGGLDNPNTNQRLKKLTWTELDLNVEDITNLFWKNYEN